MKHDTGHSFGFTGTVQLITLLGSYLNNYQPKQRRIQVRSIAHPKHTRMHLVNVKQMLLAIFVLYHIQSATSSCKDQVCESLVDIGVNTRSDWTYIHFVHWLPIRRRYLEANTFGGMPQLTYITLTRMVNGTNRYAFNGLIRLNTVVLKDNIVSHLPDQLFQNNPLMQKIVIKNSQLEDIGIGLFQNLPLLSHINLEGNLIENIKKAMFPISLVELILKNNQIDFIEEDTFHKMKKLQNLDLSENNLHNFEIAKFMVHTPRLQLLNLDSNGLQTITKLPILSNLRYLYFDNNSISTIETKSFEGTRNLEILRLSFNQVVELRSDYFGENGLSKLNRLYISHNNITCIEDNTLRLFPKMTVTWFAMNPLTCNCFKDIMKYMTENKVKVLYNYEEEWNNYKKCD